MAAVAVMALATRAEAVAPILRYQIDQRGDMILIGNTLGQECERGTAYTDGGAEGLIVGKVGACGLLGTGDTAPDIYWRGDEPDAGMAFADISIEPAQARSTAVLHIPAGSVVTYARMYWGGRFPAGTTLADPDVTVERPGVFSTVVNADANETASNTYYQSTADVTTLVQMYGEGAFRISGVASRDFRNGDDDSLVSAWSMVVLYSLASEPERDLAIFDGLGLITSGNDFNAEIEGFRVPDAGFDAKMGLMVYEGDDDLLGDSMFFDGINAFPDGGEEVTDGGPLSDAVNGATNFFNGSRSYLGVPVTVAGDLPQLSGAHGTMSGLDLDVVDVHNRVTIAQTSAHIRATSSSDTYLIGVVVTSIATYKPIFTTTTKTVTDLVEHPGGAIRSGDRLRYTVFVENTGNDDSIDTFLQDPLPPEVTYVPGSSKIVAGPNLGMLTDDPGDDQGEYDALTGTLTFRLGTGATSAQGGSVPVGASTTVTFDVIVNVGVTGTLSNQAFVTFEGAKGSPQFTTPSSGPTGLLTTTDVPVTVTPAPTITLPVSGAVLATATPAVSGTGEPGATLTLTIDGTVACTVTVSPTGTWSCTPTLADGAHTASATQATLTSVSAAATDSFTTDTKAPDTTFTAVPPAHTNNDSPTFTVAVTDPSPSSGIASLQCSLDGAAFAACPLVGTGIVGLTGLGDGQHTLAVRAVDKAGNVDPTPATDTFVVDTQVPEAPEVDNPVNGSLVNVSPTAIVGKGEPGDTVTVKEGTTVICTAVVDTNGDWTCAPATRIADGQHTFTATQKDLAGNVSPTTTDTFTVDTTTPFPPVVITPPNGSASSDNTPTFTGTAEAGSTVTITVGGQTCTTVAGAAPSGSTQGAFTCTPSQPLADGTYTALATSTDAAGNTSTPTSDTFTVDTHPPDTVIASSPPLQSSSATGTFTISNVDPAPSAAPLSDLCSLDGAAFAPCPTNGPNVVVTGLADGQHTLQVKAVDAAGNVDPTPASYTWTVDTHAPGKPVILTPVENAQLTIPNPTVTGTADPGTTVTVRDGTQVLCTATVDASGNWSCQVAFLADGPHTLTATSSDTAGNQSQPATVDITIDTSAPDTLIVTRPPAHDKHDTATFTFGSNETGVTYECALDGEAFTSCPTPDQLSGLGDGQHSLEVRAVDASGRRDPTPARAVWAVDTLPPEAPVFQTPNDHQVVATHSPPITGTGEPGTTVTVSSGGQVLGTAVVDAQGNWTLPAVTLADGNYVLTATATDAAGNVSPSAVDHVTVDTTPPDTHFTSTPPATSSSSTPTFVFAASEPNVTYQCSLDGAAFAPCPDPDTLSDVASGSHTFQVAAVDAAGNVDPTPASYTWTVDTAATFLEIDSPSNHEVVQTTPTAITGTGTPGATVTVTVDGTVVCAAAAISANGQWTCPVTGSLPEGDHHITAVSGGVTVTSVFTVDSQAPDTSFVSTPPDQSTSSTAIFEFTSNEQGVTYECSLDGAAFAPCPDPDTLTGLSNGAHTFQVRAVDAAGNTDPTPASLTWQVITEPLATPVLLSPGDGASVATPKPTLSGTADPGERVTVTIDNVFVCSTIAAADGTWSCEDPNPLADGLHQVTLLGQDATGKSSTPSHSVFTVDTTPPDTTIQDHPPATSNSNNASFTFTSNEGGVTYECSLDGAAFAPCPDPDTLSGLSNGSHTLQVRAVDAAGNKDPTPASYTWTVGTQGATLTLDTPGHGAVVGDSTPPFTGHGQPGDTVTVTVDGLFVCSAVVDAQGNWSCTGTTPLTDGQHEVVVTATNTTGFDGSLLSVFSVDTAPPDTLITSGPARANAPSTATFTFGSNESGVTYECSLDGAAFTACPTPDQLSGLANGTHTLQVRAVDAAGNKDPSPASYTWTVGGVPATTSSSSSSSSGSTGSSTTGSSGTTGQPATTGSSGTSSSSGSSGSVSSTSAGSSSGGTVGHAFGEVAGGGLLGCSSGPGDLSLPEILLGLSGLSLLARRRRR